MGETLGDYLRRRRVEVAAMRLAAQPRTTVLNIALYLKDRALNPARWAGNTRDWSHIGAVTLNPERDCIVKTHSQGLDEQPLAA